MRKILWAAVLLGGLMLPMVRPAEAITRPHHRERHGHRYHRQQPYHHGWYRR